MKHYDSIRYPGEEEAEGTFASGDIVIQEKLDGANFRFTHESNLDEQFHTDDREIVFGSRNVQFKNATDENKQFADTMEWVRKRVRGDDILELQAEYQADLTFFGESMENPHTLSYDWESTPLFLGFDVYDETNGRWLPYGEMRHAFEELMLPISPIIDVVSAEAWDEYEFETPESDFGDVAAEGVVFKNYDTQTFAKFVREDFKEKNNKAFNSKPNAEEPDYVQLGYERITNARIEKCTHKMIDEGPWDSLQMEMMAPKDGHDGLPQAVIRDMAEEEAVDIFLSESYTIDIGGFRSHISSRCAEVLRRMIDERAAKKLR